MQTYQQLELVVPTDSASYWAETGTTNKAGIMATFDAMCQSFPESDVELHALYFGDWWIKVDNAVVYRYTLID